MKTTVIAVAVLLLSFAGAATAQEKQQAVKATSNASVLEANIRRVWDGFQKKDKAAVANLLDEHFRQVEEGSSGFGDKKTQVASVDEFSISTYTLKDFTVKPLGANYALVTYLAHYEGKAGNEAINANSAFGEVWVRVGNEWKGLYTQETTVK